MPRCKRHRRGDIVKMAFSGTDRQDRKRFEVLGIDRLSS